MTHRRPSFIRRVFAGFSALLIIALSAGIAWGMQTGAHRLPLRQYFSTSYTNAVWDWTNPTVRSDQELKRLADFLYLHQLNTVYVDTTLYADIAANPNANERAIQTAKLTTALEHYIQALSKYDIKVYLGAGHTDWSQPAQRHIPLAILSYAHDYNRHHTAKLAGVEFDIESYNQDGFPEASFTEKGIVLTELLETVDQLSAAHARYIDATGDQIMNLGFAVPYWFDNENGNIKSVTWRGKTGPTIYHLIDRLNALPNANVVVMAYRNAALGNDGSIAHSRTEIDYAHAKAPHVKVLIGQETGEVEPAKITFFGQTPTELSSEVRTIYEQLGPIGSLGGIAINDLASYQKLQANE